ncbi:very-long-chain (3R)-3-hydroxyacyl-CoA dehydratase 3-like [Tigriopus californicus]|uniref:very-long-chain (3R)-3-hydroxyacyl-CoA dehydratase 3-like n=1 Tax=Tigriopus californicus TaxID=6832 RepID=UPI0027DA8C45|nr:very-long-chain (3R)-3-hydroxyacyl-CoA dehydratase 3-like [Tigriopus californicus]
MSPSPFVYWAQNESHIFLRVDLKHVQKHQLNIAEEEIEFTGYGIGAQGSSEVEYHFLIEFFLPVNREESTYLIKDRKSPSISRRRNRIGGPPFVHTAETLLAQDDFDRWTSHLIKNRYPEVYEKLQKEELGFISESRRKIYLFCYNLFMLCGFVYVFLIMNLRYARHGDEFIPETYKTRPYCSGS